MRRSGTACCGKTSEHGADGGSTVEAVLIDAADGADLLPPSVVSGADRAIDLLQLEAKLATFSALNTPSASGELRWREDSTIITNQNTPADPFWQINLAGGNGGKWRTVH